MTHPDRSESTGGESLSSHEPVTGELVYKCRTATTAEIDGVVSHARIAQAKWMRTPVEDRISILKRFAAALTERRQGLATLISREVGKPLWESLTEVDAMIGKIPLTIAATAERCKAFATDSAGVTAATRFKPHGVVAVLGPFNFPGHLPNGHIVPALLAGNAVVFKPSECAPAVAAMTAESWAAAGLPEGLLAVVQGSGDVGRALVEHDGIDGVFFTGSSRVGLSLRRALVDRPGKILALEMGGNNPLIVGQVADVHAAVYLTIQSAYITAGQRCTCARRLIVPEGETGDRFVESLATAVAAIRVGHFTARPEPFLGPVINTAAAARILHTQQNLIDRGGRPLVVCRGSSALLWPGLIDVTAIPDRADEEIFGPLLQLIRVPDFDAAIAEANCTKYGLAAGLIDDRRAAFDEFYTSVRAGVVNWNRPTTGASGAQPFGGVGMSGNHRPSGYFAADYCAFPVASLEADRAVMPATLLPGITLQAMGGEHR
jgi:succinylglutamic semialdehyde dehydrogenase